MPALAAITVNDGKATPVAHTFTPSGPDKNGVNMLYDRSGGIAIGFPMLSTTLRSPLPASNNGSSTNARVYRATVKFIVPTLEVTSPATGSGIQPAPTKAFDTVVTMEFVLPERSTTADRADILAYAKNALGHATVVTLVRDLEDMF